MLVLTCAEMIQSRGLLTRTSHLHHPGRLGFLTAQQSQSSQSSYVMSQGSECKWSCSASYDPSSIVIQCPFPTPSIGAVTAYQDSQREDIEVIFQWEGCEGHIAGEYVG